MFHSPITRCQEAPAPAEQLLPPLTAADYLRLRREAAKLSITDVAAAVSNDRAERGSAAALLRMFETPGARVSRHDTLLRLQAIFPFDPAVYQQLIDEPADRHPQICRGCGCSHWDPCDQDGKGPCAWSSTSSCTRCVPESLAA
jgi:hypothetical protein